MSRMLSVVTCFTLMFFSLFCASSSVFAEESTHKVFVSSSSGVAGSSLENPSVSVVTSKSVAKRQNLPGSLYGSPYLRVGYTGIIPGVAASGSFNIFGTGGSTSSVSNTVSHNVSHGLYVALGFNSYNDYRKFYFGMSIGADLNFGNGGYGAFFNGLGVDQKGTLFNDLNASLFDLRFNLGVQSKIGDESRFAVYVIVAPAVALLRRNESSLIVAPGLEAGAGLMLTSTRYPIGLFAEFISFTSFAIHSGGTSSNGTSPYSQVLVSLLTKFSVGVQVGF